METCSRLISSHWSIGQWREEGSRPPPNVHHTGNPEEASVTRYAKRKPAGRTKYEKLQGRKVNVICNAAL